MLMMSIDSPNKLECLFVWREQTYITSMFFLFLTPKCLPENSFFPDHNLFIINIGSQNIFFYREKNKT